MFGVRTIRGVFLFGCLIASIPLESRAQSVAAVPRSFADPTVYRAWGKELFGIYCAACHGNDGTGNGPAASALKTPPPDLTEIAKRHGGRFPRMTVVGVIDGQTPLASHGSREMPVWGRVFRGEHENSSLASPELYALADYIESIQKKTKREVTGSIREREAGTSGSERSP
jgi:mono/diheme cytochrome c family protein